MNRIIPILLIVAILVGGGLWLAQRPAETVAQSPIPEPEEPAQEVAEPVFTVPEGFELTPYLTEEAEQAFEAPEDVLEEGKDYQAVIETTQGTIRIDLFEEQVPQTVNNFIFLARHHYYDGIVFHRVLDGFMAQTGDPTGTGTGGPGYEFDDEIVEGLGHDARGTVSMANAGPGTNGSQFFITFGPTPHLDGRHTVFGTVVEGDAVLDEITRIDPGSPSAIVEADGTLEELANMGITLEGEANTSVSAYLEDKLGALPAIGQTFDIDGYKAVSGRQGETAAFGFFPDPDVMENVYIIERPKS